MKIALLVEGKTEAEGVPRFLKRWLDPQFFQPIRLHAINLGGAGKYLADYAGRAQRLLDSDEFAGVVGLLDLYGSDLPYPEGSVDEKYKWAKKELERRVARKNFRQHFAVHETEAWLLCNPEGFPAVVRNALPERKPEEVNFDNPPKAVLQKFYWEKLKRRYREAIDGPALFSKLDPQKAAALCPHLKLLLEDLLSLARAAHR